MSLEALIEAIHASPMRLSLCICGAGAGSIARLTQVPECSRTLLEADVLYHRASTRAALDGLPRHIVSAEAARRLAQHAFHVSRTLAVAEAREHTPAKEIMPDSNYIFGVGATSAIKTSRQRRSSDQVFVAVWGGAVQSHRYNPLTLEPNTMEEVGRVYDYHMNMPDTLDRAGQDRQVELLVLHAIAETVARCAVSPTDSHLVRCSGDRTYPTSLFHSLLPTDSPSVSSLLTQPPTAAATTTTTITTESHATPPLVRDSLERLCATPSRSGPYKVPLNTAHEVAQAIDAVLSYQPGSSTQAEDVCVLWNRHGELRRSGLLPYDAEYHEPIARPTNLKDVNAPVPPSAPVPPLRLLYPGSFNPLHYGHTELVQAAARVLRQQSTYQHDPHIPVEVTYEIAVKVVDKGAIARDDLQRRVAQFLERGERIAVTNAKLFISKAKLFPGHGFLIGMDTAVRVVDPQHYSTATADPVAAEAAMVAALQRDIGDRGCYFVVGGRKISDPAGWQDLSSLKIPPAIRHLFVGIPDVEFRVDISSTELRAKKRARHQPQTHPEAHSNM